MEQLQSLKLRDYELPGEPNFNDALIEIDLQCAGFTLSPYLLV